MKPGKPPRAFMPACAGNWDAVSGVDLESVARKTVSADRIISSAAEGSRSPGDMCWTQCVILGEVFGCAEKWRVLMYLGQFLIHQSQSVSFSIRLSIGATHPTASSTSISST